jgi:hypothetical protein
VSQYKKLQKMSLEHIQQVLEQAQVVLFEQEDGMLPPLLRQQIYHLAKDVFYNWHSVRSRIDWHALQKVLPLIFSDKDVMVAYNIETLVTVVQGVMNGALVQEDSLKQAGVLWACLENEIDTFNEEASEVDLPSSEKSANADYVLFALLETLYCVSGVYRFDSVLLRPDSDNQIDVWSSDTALWACLACTSEVIEERRVFWSWWLSEAIPMAWETGNLK